jgi:hypothetical protein
MTSSSNFCDCRPRAFRINDNVATSIDPSRALHHLGLDRAEVRCRHSTTFQAPPRSPARGWVFAAPSSKFLTVSNLSIGKQSCGAVTGNALFCFTLNPDFFRLLAKEGCETKRQEYVALNEADKHDCEAERRKSEPEVKGSEFLAG